MNWHYVMISPEIIVFGLSGLLRVLESL